MLPSNWCCFVINLARSPAQFRKISEQLNRLRVSFQRYEGVDNYEIALEESSYFSRKGYERRHGKLPAAGEVGCFMSHIGVLRTFLETDAEFCLVLEDDAVLPLRLVVLLDSLARNADLWDIVLLYGNHHGTPQHLAKLGEGHDLVGYFTRQTGAVAYVVNRAAASAYVHKLLPMTLPFDLEYDRAWDFGIKFRGVYPLPVTTGEHPSDIGETGRKFPLYQRLLTFADRTATELRRVLHYAFYDPIWLYALQYRYHGRVRAVLSPSLPSHGSDVAVPNSAELVN